MTEKERVIKRKKRVIEYAEKHGSIRKVCRRFGIARSTFYLWRERYRESGDEGLARRISCSSTGATKNLQRRTTRPEGARHRRFHHVKLTKEAPTKQHRPVRRALPFTQSLDPISLPGAPGRSRTCDMRFRKLDKGASGTLGGFWGDLAWQKVAMRVPASPSGSSNGSSSDSLRDRVVLNNPGRSVGLVPAVV